MDTDDEGKVVIKRHWTAADVEEKIISLYPSIPLKIIGFKLGHCMKNRRIDMFPPSLNARALKFKVGKGKLFICPCRDLSVSVVVFKNKIN